MTPHALHELATDHRMFNEVYDVIIVDDPYRSANFFVSVFDKFGRRAKVIFGNVFPKVGEPFDVYDSVMVTQGLIDHMYGMGIVHRQHTMQALAFPWAGLHVKTIMGYLQNELHGISVANGVFVEGEKVTPIRLPVGATDLRLGNEMVELRNQFSGGYRPQKLALFLERWKSRIADAGGIPKDEDELARTLEHLAAVQDLSFEYWPEGVGTVWKIGGSVTIKYRKPTKKVWIERTRGGSAEYDLPTQGLDIVKYVVEAITEAPRTTFDHCLVGTALDQLKERLANCPDDRLEAFVRSPHDFVVRRHDKEDHAGVLVTAVDKDDKVYLIFVINKNKARVRRELRPTSRAEVLAFYDVIADYMDVNK